MGGEGRGGIPAAWKTGAGRVDKAEVSDRREGLLKKPYVPESQSLAYQNNRGKREKEGAMERAKTQSRAHKKNEGQTPKRRKKSRRRTQSCKEGSVQLRRKAEH